MPTVIRYNILWLLLLFFCQFPIQADIIDPDSISSTLEEIEIYAPQTTLLKKGGSMNIKNSDFYSSLRLMGEADALNYIKRLSGMRTGGDYGSGILIDGFTPYQSIFSINSVPVFFPYRFGGIFSTFNGYHFSGVNLERGFHNASVPNRLGANVGFTTSRFIEVKPKGIINVGLLASSLSLTLPFADKFQVKISGRISYVDLLLDALVKDYDLKYNFKDLNVNAVWEINKDNIILLDAFGNWDKLKYNDNDYEMTDHLQWNNRLFSLSWEHKGSTEMTNRVYYTGYKNKLKIEMPQMSVITPSSIGMAGLSGDFSRSFHNDRTLLSYGYEINYYQETPQTVEIKGYDTDSSQESKESRPLETRLYGDVKIPIGNKMKLNGGISTSFFHNGRYNRFTIDPRLSINLPVGIGVINLHLGKYSQFLHQLGFSQIGMASDFWIASSKNIPAEGSYNLELDYTGMLGALSFSINGYWRVIRSEPDYIGEVLSLLNSDYKPEDFIQVSNGYNCGINIIGKWSIYKFDTHIGMGYGIARRHNGEIEKTVRGLTEPGFTCNADITYKLNSHWQFDAQFRYATGRPYTPIIALYVMAGNIIKEYGVPNSSLFPSNHQLDLSATWKAHTKIRTYTLTHLINFSLINAYGHKNVEIMTYNYDNETGSLSLKKIYSLYRFLPSISYTLMF